MGGRIEFDQGARAIGGGVMTRSNSRCDHRLKATSSNFGFFSLRLKGLVFLLYMGWVLTCRYGGQCNSAWLVRQGSGASVAKPTADLSLLCLENSVSAFWWRRFTAFLRRMSSLPSVGHLCFPNPCPRIPCYTFRIIHRSFSIDLAICRVFGGLWVGGAEGAY